MKRDQTGRFVSISTVSEAAKAFIPNPLPPDPPIDFTPELQRLKDKAFFALGKLDSAAAFLPEAGLFLYQYIRKEALLSCQIEGAQSSL
ncbi:MAG: Fic family protein, partial [Candidatus Dadabacteria bacterium]|nr:Fic family protein [Candidatus Dadabacteria bacterium]